ncbi:MAG: hypothetical protein GY952_02610 [Rhodobacteraceae bacterium]|nr:hypothetical protein [Paracoccaceae bacterium]
MFKRIAAATLVFGMAALAPPIAQAQQRTCGPRDNIVTQLKEKYGEVSHGAGMRSATQVLEVWSSKKTGSWSVLITDARGVTCVMAAGQNWVANPAFDEVKEPEA